jgi:hypothetical protein
MRLVRGPPEAALLVDSRQPPQPHPLTHSTYAVSK